MPCFSFSLLKEVSPPLQWELVGSDGYCTKLFHSHAGTSEPRFHRTTIIKEIAYPLTVGSFTTIGAFLGLIFTSSDLLRDFGLFASLALVGTTLFCLIYLPHFLKGQADVKQGRILRIIEKINAYSYEKNKWLVGGILLITVICLFTSQKVASTTI